MRAAKAIWDYSEASLRYIFGNSTGNIYADQILEAVQDRPDGITQSDLHTVFSRNVRKTQIESALSLLMEANLIEKRIERKLGGRSTTYWRATNYEKNEISEVTNPNS